MDSGFKNQEFQFFLINETKMCNCHPPKIVGRGNEIQLQVGENSNKIIGMGG